ncbi:hypothetical protein AO058_17165 [Salegentibacter sp. T436]|jgi:hypothetical protein|nr:hypothetical protein AO058_17165 [Salegentibacter sp. T436]
MEVAISSMGSKTCVEKRFSRNEAFAKWRVIGRTGIKLLATVYLNFFLFEFPIFRKTVGYDDNTIQRAALERK